MTGHSGRPKFGQPLTARETACLWSLAQGKTYAAMAREWKITEKGAASSGHRLLVKLGAAVAAQAVHIGMCRGLIGMYEDCGDRAAYLRHLARREPADPKCLLANAVHSREQRAGRLDSSRQGPQGKRKNGTDA